MFKRMLWRSVLTPLCAGILSCGLFAGLTIYLVKVQREVEHTEAVLSSSAMIQRLFVDAETSARGFVITGEDKFLTPYKNTLENWSQQMTALQAQVMDNPVQVKRIQENFDLFKSYLLFTEDLIRLKKESTQKAIALVATERGKKIMDQIRVTWSRFDSMERDLLKERSLRAAWVANLFLVLVAGGTLLLSMAVAFWGRKQILDLSKSYETLAEDQAKKNKILEDSQWIKNHQAQLGNILLGKINIHEFGDQVLNFLIDTLGAHAGVLFVKNEGGTFGKVSGLGLNERGSNAPQTFDLSENFLGSALKNKKIKFIEDLPPNYFQLSSGLGSTEPKSVAVVPILAREELIGALELGFLKQPDPRAEEFLKNVAEAIGTALQSIQDNFKLETLYHEIQNQAEELQAQEEELRVSNEELETQMRLLKDSQTYTEAQNAKLEESNYQLQSQALVLEEQKNLLESRNVELQHIRNEVEKKALEVERASRYKSEFLANMSHELRTPLNSTLILAQLLIDNKEGHLDSKEVEYARHIMSSGNDLLVLINDILDLSKVESGKLDLSYSEFNMGSMLQSIRNTFSPMAKAKKIEFEIQTPEEDFSLVSDRLRLEQVLKNLLSNALKFTEKGFVKLEIKKTNSEVTFVVSDSGIGIPEEHQQSIFEAFKQADGTTSRKYGGTGLGLSISKSLSRLLGGSISLSSKSGEGSQFTFKIPIRAQSPALSPSTLDLPDLKKNIPLSPLLQDFIEDDRKSIDADSDDVILIVEDDAKFASVMRDLIKDRGFKCIVCNTAESALTVANQYKLRFVILDIQLPDHSGLIVLDQLKRNPNTRYIPVQVISGKDFAAQAYKLGAVGYMIKPVVKERLDRILSELEGKFQRKSRHVLIVEDDERQQIALRNLLEDDFLETTTVKSGAETLKVLKSKEFDCVVMDLNLPDISGFEILRILAEDKEFRCPPIIVYTGKDLSTEEERELKRHSGSIIVKGARSPERLLDEVMLYLYRMDSALPQSHRKILKGVRDKDQSLERKRILLVDDDMRNIFALAAGLEKKGAIITIAKDGIEALSALDSNSELDIVLMDIMMPNMDGYTAIKEIRKQKKFKDLPILAVTAKAMKDDRDQAIAAGADDYVSKPIDMDRLVSLIRVWTMRET